tara:strand:+ start:434 stop:769 length:336 start_codon:yes stop_codon:yes gene_type:complete
MNLYHNSFLWLCQAFFSCQAFFLRLTNLAGGAAAFASNFSLDKPEFLWYIVLMKNENPNSKLDKSHPLRDMVQVQPEEVIEPYDGWEGCWPGDGSGMDDFADYNANEGCDC